MAKQDQKAEKPTHVVVKEFRDRDNFDKVHEVGSDVSHFDEDRLKHLVSIGHVEGPKKTTSKAPQNDSKKDSDKESDKDDEKKGEGEGDNEPEKKPD